MSTQLSFYDYLGLDRFESDLEFVMNMKFYKVRMFQDYLSTNIIVEYIGSGEFKQRYISQLLFIENPGLQSYLANFYK